VSQVKASTDALYLAIEKMGEAAPNARDYYPQGEGAYKAADLESRSRIERLIALRREMMDIYEGLEDQIDPLQRQM